MCEGISHSHAGMPHFQLAGERDPLMGIMEYRNDSGFKVRLRGSNGRGDEPRRAKLRTPAKAAPAQRRGLQRQQHLCMGRNSPWARVGSSSPPLAGGSRAPARLHQRPAVDQHLVSTSGRQQSTTWARGGREEPLAWERSAGVEGRWRSRGGGGGVPGRRWRAGGRAAEAEVECRGGGGGGRR
ncbi:uncharacterized protein [Triticum aestivum]|uniref:uncharacterized protein n=1 Tax=Triticum aestivum TaxID=4565 RepID=UPI001D026724|nr:uncharacterized protein LOC123111011 [Triticum aestivum]XP_044411474.1 uncharacterized protein LOC123136210 [Triticum aestivum]XP_044411475.1 uncharacterized protein LOC123136210 [Triticum aestivum]XP_044411476.1 uncharacterized protein LOC123136210 [Triticum aestivum]